MRTLLTALLLTLLAVPVSADMGEHDGHILRHTAADLIVASDYLPDISMELGIPTDIWEFSELEQANMITLISTGISVGCDTEPLRYCPHQHVTVGQAALFMARLFLDDFDGSLDTALLYVAELETMAHPHVAIPDQPLPADDFQVWLDYFAAKETM